MKIKYLVFSSIMLLLALVACNPAQETMPASSSTDEVVVQESMDSGEETQSVAEEVSPPEAPAMELTEAVQPQEVSACYHPYFPIVDGAYWTYQQPETGNYTLRIEETGEDTFKMLQDMESDDVIFTVEWFCSEDGLLRGTFGQMDLLDYSSEEEGSPEFQFETLEWEGETLPAPELIEEGYTWESDYSLSADYDIEGFSGQLQVTVVIQHEIIGTEEVTVPAGTFSEALRVDSMGNIEMIMVISEDSITPFSSIDFSYSTWYVEGIGMVKSSESMSGFSSSTELVETSFQ